MPFNSHIVNKPLATCTIEFSQYEIKLFSEKISDKLVNLSASDINIVHIALVMYFRQVGKVFVVFL